MSAWHRDFRNKTLAQATNPGTNRMKQHQQPGSAQDPALYDWQTIEQGLNSQGHALLPGLLAQKTYKTLAALYTIPRSFNMRVMDMYEISGTTSTTSP